MNNSKPNYKKRNNNHYDKPQRPAGRYDNALSENNLDECLVYGRNSVKELLKSERTVDKIYIVRRV